MNKAEIITIVDKSLFSAKIYLSKSNDRWFYGYEFQLSSGGCFDGLCGSGSSRVEAILTAIDVMLERIKSWHGTSKMVRTIKKFRLEFLQPDLFDDNAEGDE